MHSHVFYKKLVHNDVVPGPLKNKLECPEQLFSNLRKFVYFRVNNSKAHLILFINSKLCNCDKNEDGDNDGDNDDDDNDDGDYGNCDWKN